MGISSSFIKQELVHYKPSRTKITNSCMPCASVIAQHPTTFYPVMVVDAAATPTLASNIGPAKTGPTGPLAPALYVILKSGNFVQEIFHKKKHYFRTHTGKQFTATRSEA